MSVPPAPSVPPLPVHGPHREDCPWCGSRRLRPRPRLRDPRRHPPVRPALDRCRDCGHAFRNPLAGQGTDHPAVRAGSRLRHVLAARAVFRRCPEPESWLDVGTGDADFPHTARRWFPYTSFDGVDPTPRVLRARAAERVEEAHVGRLTDPLLAARLRARYDVVSLFQQLERVPDPRAELAAALDALRPGGLLLLDVADPRRLRALAPGGTPHPAGLAAELERRGSTVLTAPQDPRLIARKEASAA
ncbi:methyltransferase domain-containing protein [Streptomyces sp. SCSIO 75703]|uniref:methyltransferase domain-containing protein n=1 Tax=unclassified Streptomyces TaxID=2593676 RepID=UPI0004BFFCD9|nr:methyltransferase domain-containing protein [Streptomyces sp. NRRL F-5065]